jgi:hypothetical protein
MGVHVETLVSFFGRHATYPARKSQTDETHHQLDGHDTDGNIECEGVLQNTSHATYNDLEAGHLEEEQRRYENHLSTS